MADKIDKTVEEISKEISKNISKIFKQEEERFNRTSTAIQRRARELDLRAQKMDDVSKSIDQNLGKISKEMLLFGKEIKSTSEALDVLADSTTITGKQLDDLTKTSKQQILNSLKNAEDLKKIGENSVKEISKVVDGIKSFRDLADVSKIIENTYNDLAETKDSFKKSIEGVSAMMQKLGYTEEETREKISEANKERRKQISEQIKEGRKAAKEARKIAEEANDPEAGEKYKRAMQELREKAKSSADSLESIVLKNTDLEQTLENQIQTYGELIKKVHSIIGEFEKLGKSSLQPFKKYVDDSSKSLKQWAAQTFTVAFSVKKLIDGVRKGYEEFVKINSVGLAGTFEQLQGQVLKYGISFEKLMKITDENRVQIYQQAINGAQSFKDAQSTYLDSVTEISKETGAEARYGPGLAAEIVASHMKTTAQSGVNYQSPEGKKLTKALIKNQMALQAVTGESAETTISNVNAIRDMTENLSILAEANEAQRVAIMRNISAQYEQYRLQGLSNEQIQQRIQTEKDAANPLKGQFIEKIKARFLGPVIGALQDKLAGVEGDTLEDRRILANYRFGMSVKQQQDLKNRAGAQDETGKYLDTSDEAKAAQKQLERIELAKYHVGKAEAFKQTNLSPTSAAGGVTNVLQGQIPGGTLQFNEQDREKYLAGFKGVQGANAAGGINQGTPEILASAVGKAVAASVNVPMQTAQTEWEKLATRFDSTIGKFLEGTGALLIAAAMQIAAAGASMLSNTVFGKAINSLSKISGLLGLAVKGIALGVAYAVGYAVGTIVNKGVELLTGKGAGLLLGDTVSKLLGKIGIGTGGEIGFSEQSNNITSAVSPEEIAAARQNRLAREEAQRRTTGNAATSVSREQVVKPVENKVQGNAATSVSREQVVKPISNKQTSKEREEQMIQSLSNAGITDPKQQAILMGRLAHESGGFTQLTELGKNAGQQYEGRKNLGNTQIGDGQKYKGRGYIQLTGRANYAAASKALGVDFVNNPELAAEPKYAADIATWYLTTHKDKSGKTAAQLALTGDIRGVTRNINGGENGLADTQKRTEQYLASIGTKKQSTLSSEPTMTAASSVVQPTDFSDASNAMFGGTTPVTSFSPSQNTQLLASETKTQSIVPPVPVPSVSPINNIDKMIADNIDKSNKHLASINSGIERLIQISSGRLGNNMQKVPQTSTQVFNKG